MGDVPIRIGPHEPSPDIVFVYPLRKRRRARRALFVVVQTIHLWTPDGWIRIPRGYVTDFGSIPYFATWLTLGRLQPLGVGLLAFLNHDWPYAVGEPGLRDRADAWLDYRLKLDGESDFNRKVIVAAVRAGGGGGYRRAPTWWNSENFADPLTGQYPVAPPPFEREDAYDGRPWGLRPEPDWPEAA